jgi:hypothetical protein
VDLVPCPPRVCLITYKWVYKVKTRSNGSLGHYKDRLVAHLFQQEQSHDYDGTFAHVAQMTTVPIAYHGFCSGVVHLSAFCKECIS